MTKQDIEDAIEAFGQGARRALEAGFDLVEVHGAHGYLIHQFLSPLSNKRTDEYGGNLENRCRFALEVLERVHKYWPSDRPVSIRLSCTDWAPNGWDLDQTVELAKTIRRRGLADIIDCSAGGTTPEQAIPETKPGYQVEYAARVRRELAEMPEKNLPSVLVAAVGLISEPAYAEEILQEGKADLIFMGRAFLRDPRWALNAAMKLGVRTRPLPQYTATLMGGPIFKMTALKLRDEKANNT